jgi:hypothetical protein
MTLETCVNLRTLGYRVTGVQRYLLGALASHASRVEYTEAANDNARDQRTSVGAVLSSHSIGAALLWSPGNTGPIGVSRQVLTVHDMASL